MLDKVILAIDAVDYRVMSADGQFTEALPPSFSLLPSLFRSIADSFIFVLASSLLVFPLHPIPYPLSLPMLLHFIK